MFMIHNAEMSEVFRLCICVPALHVQTSISSLVLLSLGWFQFFFAFLADLRGFKMIKLSKSYRNDLFVPQNNNGEMPFSSSLPPACTKDFNKIIITFRSFLYSTSQPSENKLWKLFNTTQTLA